MSQTTPQMSLELLVLAIEALDAEAEVLRGDNEPSEVFTIGSAAREQVQTMWGLSETRGVAEFVKNQVEGLFAAYSPEAAPPYAVFLRGLVAGFRAGGLAEMSRELDA